MKLAGIIKSVHRQELLLVFIIVQFCFLGWNQKFSSCYAEKFNYIGFVNLVWSRVISFNQLRIMFSCDVLERMKGSCSHMHHSFAC